MTMTLAVLYKGRNLVLVAGFENGMCSVFVLHEHAHEWFTTYRGQSHSQPVLSLDVDVKGEFFISSAADSLIAKHPVPVSSQTVLPNIMASVQNVAATDEATSAPPTATTGIGALFTSQAKTSSIGKLATKAWEDPIKVANTKHAGQQSLSIRSDGRVFATAGWDSKVRVYATKSLKELAVLKWHQVGVYAAVFAQIKSQTGSASADGGNSLQIPPPIHEDVPDTVVSTPSEAKEMGAMTAKDRRLHLAKHTHWVVAGAKDGKLSLWDIY